MKSCKIETEIEVEIECGNDFALAVGQEIVRRRRWLPEALTNF